MKILILSTPSWTVIPQPSHSTISLISSLRSPRQPQQMSILANFSSMGPPFDACSRAFSITCPTVIPAFVFPNTGSSVESSESSESSSSSSTNQKLFQKNSAKAEELLEARKWRSNYLFQLHWNLQNRRLILHNDPLFWNHCRLNFHPGQSQAMTAVRIQLVWPGAFLGLSQLLKK